jgi:hypothetical protein
VDAVGLTNAGYGFVQQRSIAIPPRNTPARSEDTISDRKTNALRATGHDRNPVF